MRSARRWEMGRPRSFPLRLSTVDCGLSTLFQPDLLSGRDEVKTRLRRLPGQLFPVAAGVAALRRFEKHQPGQGPPDPIRVFSSHISPPPPLLEPAPARAP